MVALQAPTNVQGAANQFASIVSTINFDLMNAAYSVRLTIEEAYRYATVMVEVELESRR